MKVAIVLCAILGLGLAAPQPRKLFHDHVSDFLDIIKDAAGNEIDQLMETYLEYEEFQSALEYLKTNSFKTLVNEMENLPEFQAVIDFLENDNIDIHFFLDLIDEMIDSTQRRSRQSTSGKDFASFIEDSIAVFPKDKLAALFDQKIAEDEAFATSIQNLGSDEWDAVFSALWENETFKAEVDALFTNGIDLHAVLHEIIAIFGQ